MRSLTDVYKRQGKEIKTLTGKQGADVIIETSGYADALQSALRGLAYGGTISYVAFAKPFAEGFNLGREAHFNNAKIVLDVYKRQAVRLTE